MGIVEREAQLLATALGRAFESESLGTQIHVVQTCPLCEARLGLWVEYTLNAERLHRQLFALYDEHRCVADNDQHTLFERAERALVAAAERIGTVEDAELRARAEAEADRMAEVAQRLRARF